MRAGCTVTRSAPSAAAHGSGDRLEYALSLDPLSRPVNAWYVRPLVERVFDHRGEVIAKRLRAARSW
jgi:hypothetical protein